MYQTPAFSPLNSYFSGVIKQTKLLAKEVLTQTNFNAKFNRVTISDITKMAGFLMRMRNAFIWFLAFSSILNNRQGHVPVQQVEISVMGEDSGQDGEMTETPVEIPAPTYLHAFTDWMFCIGSGMHNCQAWNLNGPTEMAHSVIVHSFFWAAVISGLEETKYFAFFFVVNRKLADFMKVGIYVSKVFMRLKVWLLTLKRGKKGFSSLIGKFELLRLSYVGQVVGRPKAYAIVTAIGIYSMTNSALWAASRPPKGEWSTERLILLRSFDIGISLEAWKNSTELVDHISEKYGTNLTATTGTLGVIGVGLGYAGYMFDNIINDLILFTTMTNYFEVKTFVDMYIPCRTDLMDELIEREWKHFLLMKEASDDVTANIGPLLKLTFPNHILLFATFLFKLWNVDVFNLRFLLITLDVIKVLVSYYFAMKTYKYNGPIRGWVKERCREKGGVLVNGQLLRLQILLDDLTQDPIGIGREEFLITQGFLYKMLGMGATLFAYMIASD